MTNSAQGSFEVTMIPTQPDDGAVDQALGRLILDKRYFGDLEAASSGQMLTAGTNIANSAGYVAIERVSGTLHGRQGTFVLQHTGIMNRGVPSLTITVVPDSGTDQLEGIEGTMSISIDDGNHSYTLTYSIADAS